MQYENQITVKRAEERRTGNQMHIPSQRPGIEPGSH